MGRRVDVDNLVGATEIARRLGTTRGEVVHSWRYRDDTFPEPVARIERVYVWSWPDVRAWAKRTGRL